MSNISRANDNIDGSTFQQKHSELSHTSQTAARRDEQTASKAKGKTATKLNTTRLPSQTNQISPRGSNFDASKDDQFRVTYADPQKSPFKNAAMKTAGGGGHATTRSPANGPDK